MEISETALSVFLFTSDNAMAKSNGCLNNRAIQNCQTITQICAFFDIYLEMKYPYDFLGEIILFNFMSAKHFENFCTFFALLRENRDNCGSAQDLLTVSINAS